MGKIKNITPEERENALALIRKCGLEETEENINYYVRMQRDSKKHRGEKEISSEESPNENKADGVRVLTPKDEKKVVRIAKAGRWIIFFAIILTFVKAGFGFSFWWYIYLILLALVAIAFWGVTIPDSDSKTKTYNSNDVSIIKTFSWIGGIMLAILYLWGPLNSNYHSGDTKPVYSSSLDAKPKNEKPSWLTKWKFVMELKNGGKVVLKLSDDGTFRMSTLDHTGTPFLIHEGVYSIEGNRVNIIFIKDGKSEQTWLEMDFDQQRLYGKGGGVFKQSI